MPDSARYTAIVAAALECIVTMDHEGRIVEFNPAAERTFGYARADVIGRMMADVIIPPGLRERHRAGLAHYLATGEGPVLGRRIEIDALHADGAEFPVELTIIRLPADGPPLFTGFIRDITDRRRAETERSQLLQREQEARRRAEAAERRASFLAEAGALLSRSLDYETIFENLVQLAVPTMADWCAAHVVDDDGGIRCVAFAHRDPAITEVAAPYIKRYRFDPEAAEGGPKVIRTREPVLYPTVPSDLIERMARDADDLRMRTLIGLESVLAVPVMSGPRVLGALVFVMAKSGRRYEPEDLALAEDLARRAALAIDNALLYRETATANRMKDEFLATLSHELRTPLTSILGWASRLNTGALKESDRAHALRVIERNARSQNALINDLLDMSNIVRGRVVLERAPVRVPAVVRAAVETVRPAADAKDITIAVTIEAAAETTRLIADAERLQQIFWNVLANAVKFTSRGGVVSVTVSRADREIVVTIADNGSGIDPAVLPHVFERFRQADSSTRRAHGGLGLGLAIVRHLLELHGGTVTAHSAGPGQGATFTVRLPVTGERTDAERATPPRQRAVAEPLGGVAVLVVEDDADARDLLTRILEDAGATVRCAVSAADARAALGSAPPDVVIADLGLPDENGEDLIRALRALPNPRVARLPALAVTAYAMPGHRSAALAAGFQAYLAKPLEPADLVSAVLRLLHPDPAPAAPVQG